MTEDQINVLKDFILHKASLANSKDLTDKNAKAYTFGYTLGVQQILSNLDYVLETSFEAYFNEHLREELREDKL